MDWKYPLPVQTWQNKMTGQIIECSGSFVPLSPEWHLTFRRVRLLRHRVTGELTIEDATVETSARENPDIYEMTLVEYREWRTLMDNPDI